MTGMEQRTPSGQPTGGEYAPKTHTESDITLTRKNPTMAPLEQVQLNHYTRSLSFFLLEDGKRERFITDQPYQRGNVWDETRKRNLIKSLLIGLPIGAIILNDRGFQEGGGPDLAVIDGKQRIEALRAFTASEFPIPAAWLRPTRIETTTPMDYEGDTIDGIRYNGTDDIFRRNFDNLAITGMEARLPNEAAEAETFLLINAGGIAQTEETLQRARNLS